MAADTAYIANRLSPAAAILFGAFSFSLLYWIFPTFILYQTGGTISAVLRPLIEVLIARHIHWAQYAGIALGLICLIVATWKYFAGEALDAQGERDASLFARILARLLR